MKPPIKPKPRKETPSSVKEPVEQCWFMTSEVNIMQILNIRFQHLSTYTEPWSNQNQVLTYGKNQVTFLHRNRIWHKWRFLCILKDITQAEWLTTFTDFNHCPFPLTRFTCIDSICMPNKFVEPINFPWTVLEGRCWGLKLWPLLIARL